MATDTGKDLFVRLQGLLQAAEIPVTVATKIIGIALATWYLWERNQRVSQSKLEACSVFCDHIEKSLKAGRLPVSQKDLIFYGCVYLLS